MTTPRDEATALLAEALKSTCPDPMGCDDHREQAQSFLAASPTLAADLEFAAAWRRVERALPDGWMLYGVRQFRITVDAERYRATAYADRPPETMVEVGRQSRCDGYGPTPTAALTRLAETLEGVSK